jgi:hypothetical protein
MAVVREILQNPLARDYGNPGRKSSSERRAGEACASCTHRRSFEPLPAGRGGRIRDQRAAHAPWARGRGANAFPRDTGERRAPGAPARSAEARAALASAARFAPRQARSAAPGALAPRSDLITDRKCYPDPRVRSSMRSRAAGYPSARSARSQSRARRWADRGAGDSDRNGSPPDSGRDCGRR